MAEARGERGCSVGDLRDFHGTSMGLPRDFHAGSGCFFDGSPRPEAAELRPGRLDGALEFWDLVTLTNLKQAASLNGSRGVLERFDGSSGRWEVKLLSTGDVKAIRPDNLLADSQDWDLESGLGNEAQEAPPSPVPEIAPRSPPPAPSELTGRAGARSSGAPPPPAKPARRMGTIRWYNGRRRLGAIIPDGEGADLFIPAQGAPNGSQVPPQPGGLFHGTRVSFLPMTIKADAANGRQKAETVGCPRRKGQDPANGIDLDLMMGLGQRPEERNDDRVAAQDLHELGFLTGIFDGHRGGSCAEFAAKQVPPNVLSAYRTRAKRGVLSEKKAALIAESLVESFEAWLQSAKKKDVQEGSTGIVALVSHGFTAPVEAKAPTGCAALWPKPKDTTRRCESSGRCPNLRWQSSLWPGQVTVEPCCSEALFPQLGSQLPSTTAPAFRVLAGMDQTPARSRRASRCSFLDETPGKVAKPARQIAAMDVVKGKEDIGKLTGGEGRDVPTKEDPPKVNVVTGAKTRTVVQPEEEVSRTVTLRSDVPGEMPTFELDGITYRVRDMDAWHEKAEYACGRQVSLAELKKQRKRSAEKSEETMKP
eukprot:s1464_g5.t1